MLDEPVTIVCPECGEIEAKVSDLRLYICFRHPGAPIEVTGVFYSVTCPGCHVYFVRQTHEHGFALLRHYGVLTFSCHRPAEFNEPHPQGPPLKLDDLIDLNNELEELLGA
jgi:ribosomal protein S27E